MLVFAVSLAAIAAVTTAISLFGFNVDLAIASLFYDPATKTFLAGNESPSHGCAITAWSPC